MMVQYPEMCMWSIFLVESRLKMVYTSEQKLLFIYQSFTDLLLFCTDEKRKRKISDSVL